LFDTPIASVAGVVWGCLFGGMVVDSFRNNNVEYHWMMVWVLVNE
jgi:hypothetical protein